MKQKYLKKQAGKKSNEISHITSSSDSNKSQKDDNTINNSGRTLLPSQLFELPQLPAIKTQGPNIDFQIENSLVKDYRSEKSTGALKGSKNSSRSSSKERKVLPEPAVATTMVKTKSENTRVTDQLELT